MYSPAISREFETAAHRASQLISADSSSKHKPGEIQFSRRRQALLLQNATNDSPQGLAVGDTHIQVLHRWVSPVYKNLQEISDIFGAYLAGTLAR
jgi:hypothetical protein